MRGRYLFIFISGKVFLILLTAGFALIVTNAYATTRDFQSIQRHSDSTPAPKSSKSSTTTLGESWGDTFVNGLTVDNTATAVSSASGKVDEQLRNFSKLPKRKLVQSIKKVGYNIKTSKVLATKISKGVSRTRGVIRKMGKAASIMDMTANISAAAGAISGGDGVGTGQVVVNAGLSTASSTGGAFLGMKGGAIAGASVGGPIGFIVGGAAGTMLGAIIASVAYDEYGKPVVSKASEDFLKNIRDSQAAADNRKRRLETDLAILRKYDSLEVRVSSPPTNQDLDLIHHRAELIRSKQLVPGADLSILKGYDPPEVKISSSSTNQDPDLIHHREALIRSKQLVPGADLSILKGYDPSEVKISSSSTNQDPYIIHHRAERIRIKQLVEKASSLPISKVQDRIDYLNKLKNTQTDLTRMKKIKAELAVLNARDLCPNNPNKKVPGVYGCDSSNTDTTSVGVPGFVKRSKNRGGDDPRKSEDDKIPSFVRKSSKKIIDAHVKEFVVGKDGVLIINGRRCKPRNDINPSAEDRKFYRKCNEYQKKIDGVGKIKKDDVLRINGRRCWPRNYINPSAADRKFYAECKELQKSIDASKF